MARGIIMKKAVIILTNGFEEIEALSVVDILRRCEITVDVAGTEENLVEGAHGVKVVPDKHLNDVNIDDYDALILPGGAPGYINLRKNEKVLDLVREAYEKKKLVAAICAAPVVLADAGILKGKKATIYPGMEKEIEKGGGEFIDDLVVHDGNIVTSRGPSTALLFGWKLAEILAGKEIADQVAERMLRKLVFG